ncbi:hypothetical protein BJ322DRAFT_596245 [Thelephora terrestris]|uniref:C2H2-type domain-containing protein n=1 Tax=Thelephora terrestris TaxID=56493 RepID=A0A9P6L8G1_9AGAM|nr:hypothetical protein BJ322DRAFT_596245 [Thelephora terrestris]
MREEEEEEEEYLEGEEEESDEDAEAAEIARRLGDQLMADIAKAQAEQAAAAAIQTQELVSPPCVIPPTSLVANGDPTAAAISTMKSILAYATKDPLVNFVLASATVIDPAGNKTNALQILQRSADAGFIPLDLARIFTPVVLQLSQSETLFGSKDVTAASTPFPETGKRKRHDAEDQPMSTGFSEGTGTEAQDVLFNMRPAVQAILNTLSAGELPFQNDSSPTPLNPALISSIQVPLHQVFLFAVTIAPSVAQPQGGALQEIGGLIQMLGVLSGINIGPGLQHPQSLGVIPHDLSTAVYPCLIPACHKTFSRLYSLRSHQRNHSTHPAARPYQCPLCPASFARNHDLKRHVKLHGSKAYKCSGCDKTFSRRDAIKRHMNSSRLKTESNNPSSANIVLGRREEAERCRDAEVIEVEVLKEGGSDEAKEEKRAKSWGDKLASAVQDGLPGSSSGDSSFEEGEIPSHSLAEAQRLVLDLFPLLSRYVANYAPRSSEPVTGADPARTVASLMAGQSWSQGSHTTDTTNIQNEAPMDPGLSSLSLSWLSPEQTKQLEDAIAAAAKSAQEQAEAEAALEEEEEEGEDDDMEEVEPTA